MPDPRALDVVVIAVYLLVTLSIGIRYTRQARTADGFTTGSKRVPTWALGLSVLGTFISSISFVGNAGKAYTDNWAPLLFAFTVVGVALAAGPFFVRTYRHLGSVSAYKLLEDRFGYWARVYSSLSFQLIMLGRVSVILYLVALVVAPIAGLSLPTVILITGLLVTLYTMLGGMEAVIWTDVMQVIVMVGGALWCLLQILLALPAGPFQAVSIAAGAGHKFDLGRYDWSWSGQTFLGVLVYGILANIQNFGTDQNYTQRYLTARDEQSARKALVVAVWPYLPMTALFLAIGTGLFAFYRVFPQRLPIGIQGDLVFPHYIRTELPAGVAGLVVAAILAAAMSTISSNLNCMATVCVEDLWKRWRRLAGDAAQVRLLRALTIFWGLAGTFLGALMIGARSALDTFWQIAALVGSGMLGVFLLAVLPIRVARWAVPCATAVAVVFVAYGNFALQGVIDPLLIGALGTLLLVASGLLLSRLPLLGLLLGVLVAAPLSGQIRVERLFGPEVPTGPYKHPAALEALDNGDLYLVYYGGAGEYATGTALYSSRLRSGSPSWTPPRLIAADPFRSLGNGVPWQAPDKTFWLFYVVRFGSTWSTSRIAAKISLDHGASWSDPSLLTLEAGHLVRGKPVALAGGEILLPAYFEAGNDPEFLPPETHSVFFRYDPKSKDWRKSGVIRSAKGNLQPAAAEIAPGRLVAFCRRAGGYGAATGGYIIRSESADAGRTWSEGVNTALPNPNAAVELLKLAGGRLLLVFNDSMTRRTPLVAALSEDGGKTWPYRRNIAAGSGSFAYPSAAQTPDGLIHLVFTSDERSVIRYATFRESDLLPGAPARPRR